MNKKTFTPNKRKAFSLIELSIVLIIIGLLIAGVTGGASLIKNAQLRKVTEEARGYQTAVNSFYAKYNALPGDYNVDIGTMTGSAVTGHTSDGLIQYYAAVSSYVNTARAESNIAWQQLKNDNFISDAFTPGSADSTGVTGSGAVVAATPGTNIPASKSAGGGWIFDNITVSTLTASAPTVVATTTQNVVMISAGVPAISTGASVAVTASSLMTSGSSSSATGNSQLLPTDALSIDVKVDDGNPDIGSVTSLNTNCNTASTAASSVVTPGKYSTTNNYKACSMAFKVDPNS